MFRRTEPMHPRNKTHHTVRSTGPNAEGKCQGVTWDDHIVVHGKDRVGVETVEGSKSRVEVVLVMQIDLEGYFVGGLTRGFLNRRSKDGKERIGRWLGGITPDNSNGVQVRAKRVQLDGFLEQIRSSPSVDKHCVALLTVQPSNMMPAHER